MAQGDCKFFNQFWEDVGNKLHDLSADTFHLGIVDNTTIPLATIADPRWGIGGSTDFSANEVTPGGNYAANGPSISVVITDNWVRALSVNTIDFDDVSIAVNAANPTGAYWGIIYNTTDAGKRAVGFIELGGPIDMTAGSFSIVWNSSGFATLS